MTPEHQEFLRLVDAIGARPAVYLGNRGRSDFQMLLTFLDGYVAGIAKCNPLKAHPFGNLLTIMEDAHGFSHAAWGWPRHYLHDKGSEERAIREFPSFLKECLEISDARIEEMSKARGRLVGKAPKSPRTSKYEK
jgi:hypothetical protein